MRMGGAYLENIEHPTSNIQQCATGSGGQIFICVSNLARAPWKSFVYLDWFMNDEPPKLTQASTPRRPLEQRLARRPEMLARLHQLADTLDASVGDDCTADQVEERVSQQVRQLAQAVLAQWAHEANAHTQAQVPTRHPAAIRHGKKRLTWQTTFGWVAVEEAQWRLGRRGALLRPFCERAGVRQ
jgi:hypothetical protein